MLSNAYFVAKFRFDTAENEPAKNLQNIRKMHFRKMHFSKMHFLLMPAGLALSPQVREPEPQVAGPPRRAGRLRRDVADRRALPAGPRERKNRSQTSVRDPFFCARYGKMSFSPSICLLHVVALSISHTKVKILHLLRMPIQSAIVRCRSSLYQNS